MIDTDKYEGHKLDDVYLEGTSNTPFQRWSVMNLPASSCFNGISNMSKPTAQLIADAPLLLAEVKRLREENEKLYDFIESHPLIFDGPYTDTWKEMIE